MFKKEVLKGHSMKRELSSFQEFKEYFMENYTGALRVVIDQPTTAGISLHLNYVADELKTIITNDTIIIEHRGKPLLGINDSCNICIRYDYGSGAHFHCGYGQDSFEYGFIAIWFLPEGYEEMRQKDGSGCAVKECV